ncbi:MAG: DUF4272 domain-containing protein [Phycisphaerales bacterium]|jgi:hypothetical protein
MSETNVAIRAMSERKLTRAGFRFAKWLPLPSIEEAHARPATQIALRLAALCQLCLLVAAPEDKIPSQRLIDVYAQAKLEEGLTPAERAIWLLPREEAHAAHVDKIGWRLENMLALAWALGHVEECGFDGAMLQGDAIERLMLKIVPTEAKDVVTWIAGAKTRAIHDLVAMEDVFYCAHNAARNASLGTKRSILGIFRKHDRPVPDGFDPRIHGGVIQERRHALTWILSPATAWDDTDLST